MNVEHFGRARTLARTYSFKSQRSENRFRQLVRSLTLQQETHVNNESCDVSLDDFEDAACYARRGNVHIDLAVVASRESLVAHVGNRNSENLQVSVPFEVVAHKLLAQDCGSLAHSTLDDICDA